MEGLGLPGGGLTPRYLVPARPPVVSASAGTLDADIVIDLQPLADTEAYHTLEDNLKRMDFERAENKQGARSNCAKGGALSCARPGCFDDVRPALIDRLLAETG